MQVPVGLNKLYRNIPNGNNIDYTSLNGVEATTKISGISSELLTENNI